MLFNTLQYACFLLAVVVLYWLFLAHRRHSRNLFLLVASYVFYGVWDWRFLILIFAVSLGNHAIALANKAFPARGRLCLAAAVAFNLAVLALFKYFDFFIHELNVLLSAAGIDFHLGLLGIVLPVGLSFYILQLIGYHMDIRRKVIEPETDVLSFFCFVCFFPQLVAGPIERAAKLIIQFKAPKRFDADKARSSLKLLVAGAFKKVVIADTIGIKIDAVFNGGLEQSGLGLVAVACLYSIQILCDFSGYSDMAVGSAGLLGFDLSENFNRPYFARNVREFWHRWHVTLSTWFRDYLYIPLGGNRVGPARHAFNIMVTFLASGLWHGASTTFLLWGGVHGLLYLASSPFRGPVRPWADKPLVLFVRGAVTFLLVSLAWVFFRSPDIGFALSYFHRMLTGPFWSPDTLQYAPFLLASGVFLLAQWITRNRRHLLDLGFLPAPVRYACYYVFLTSILAFGGRAYEPFIYFQF